MAQENKSQKKVDYREMSDKCCSVCKKPLKKNVISRNQHAKLCYVCFKLSQGKKTSQPHKVLLSGEKIPLKKVDFVALQKENIRLYKSRR